jgi:acyl-coenzyme A thioesterase PaaI-like protein
VAVEHGSYFLVAPFQTCSGGFIITQLNTACFCFLANGEYNLVLSISFSVLRCLTNYTSKASGARARFARCCFLK